MNARFGMTRYRSGAERVDGPLRSVADGRTASSATPPGRSRRSPGATATTGSTRWSSDEATPARCSRRSCCPGGARRGAGRRARGAAGRRHRDGARRPRRDRLAARRRRDGLHASTAARAPATVTTPLMAQPADAARPHGAGDLHGRRRRQRHHVLLRRAGDRERRRVRELAHRAGDARGPRSCSGAQRRRAGELLPRRHRLGRRARAAGRATASPPPTSIDHGESVDVKVQGAAGDDRRPRDLPHGLLRRRRRAAVLDDRSTCPSAPSPAASSDPSLGLLDCAELVGHARRSRRRPTGRRASTSIRVTRNDTRRRAPHPARRCATTRATSDDPLRRPVQHLPGVQQLGRQVALRRQVDRRRRPSRARARAVKVSFDRPYQQPHDGVAARLVHARRLRDGERGSSARATTSSYSVGARDLERTGARRARPPRLHLRRARRVLLGGDARPRSSRRATRGVDLFFTGANEVYWKVRFEPSPVSGAPGPRARLLQVDAERRRRTRAGSPPARGATRPARTGPRTRCTGGMYIGQKAFDVLPAAGQRRRGQGPHLALHRAREPGRRRARPRSAPASSAGSGTRASPTARSRAGVEDARLVARPPATSCRTPGASTRPARRISHVAKYTGRQRRAGRRHRHQPLELGPRAQLRAATASPTGASSRRRRTSSLDMGAAPETPAAGHRARRPGRAAASITLRSPAPSATDVQPDDERRARRSRARWTRRRSRGSTCHAHDGRRHARSPAAVTYDDRHASRRRSRRRLRARPRDRPTRCGSPARSGRPTASPSARR